MSDTSVPELAVSLLRAVEAGENTTEIERELAALDREELLNALPDDRVKKAVWIDLYNAFAQLPLETNPRLFENRGTFFGAKRIPVAGRYLSLDDIEHGLLRRSQLSWGARLPSGSPTVGVRASTTGRATRPVNPLRDQLWRDELSADRRLHPRGDRIPARPCERIVSPRGSRVRPLEERRARPAALSVVLRRLPRSAGDPLVAPALRRDRRLGDAADQVQGIRLEPRSGKLPRVAFALGRGTPRVGDERSSDRRLIARTIVDRSTSDRRPATGRGTGGRRTATKPGSPQRDERPASGLDDRETDHRGYRRERGSPTREPRHAP